MIMMIGLRDILSIAPEVASIVYGESARVLDSGQCYGFFIVYSPDDRCKKAREVLKETAGVQKIHLLVLLIDGMIKSSLHNSQAAIPQMSSATAIIPEWPCNKIPPGPG